jgi:hypothetical protein
VFTHHPTSTKHKKLQLLPWLSISKGVPLLQEAGHQLRGEGVQTALLGRRIIWKRVIHSIAIDSCLFLNADRKTKQSKICLRLMPGSAAKG